jgi:hypothetical protein
MQIKMVTGSGSGDHPFCMGGEHGVGNLKQTETLGMG